MQGTYSELRDLAVSQDLIERLMMALADVAVEVYADPTESEQHKLYAVTVAKSPRSVATQMKEVVVILAADASDEALKTAAGIVFNVYASTVTVPAEPV
jgi:hypothetical protein